MVKKMYVTKGVSQKTGKEYLLLKIDFGYRVADVFLDNSLLAELSGVSIDKIYSLKPNEILPIKIGE